MNLSVLFLPPIIHTPLRRHSTKFLAITFKKKNRIINHVFNIDLICFHNVSIQWRKEGRKKKEWKENKQLGTWRRVMPVVHSAPHVAWLSTETFPNAVIVTGPLIPWERSADVIRPSTRCALTPLGMWQFSKSHQTVTPTALFSSSFRCLSAESERRVWDGVVAK